MAKSVKIQHGFEVFHGDFNGKICHNSILDITYNHLNIKQMYSCLASYADFRVFSGIPKLAMSDS